MDLFLLITGCSRMSVAVERHRDWTGWLQWERSGFLCSNTCLPLGCCYFPSLIIKLWGKTGDFISQIQAFQLPATAKGLSDETICDIGLWHSCFLMDPSFSLPLCSLCSFVTKLCAAVLWVGFGNERLKKCVSWENLRKMVFLMKTEANSKDLLLRSLMLYVKRMSDSLIILFPVQREVAGS